jgi:hypothetical protein
MMQRFKLIALWFLVLVAPSCVTMKHEIAQDKPLEINVNVRLIDDRLEDFYAFEQKYHGATTQPSSGAPATQPAAS